MAESVSDQNVEDMLSSVRRLVSSELPRKQRPSLHESASALVLTEAQRVEPKPPMQAQRGLTLEERIAELEAAVDGQSNDWEPDGSEDQELHRPDRIVYRPAGNRDGAPADRPRRLSEISLIETGPAHEDAVDDTQDAEPEADVPEFQHETGSVEPEPNTAEDGLDLKRDAASHASKDTVAPPAAFAGDPFADAIARDVAAVVAEMAESSLKAEKNFEAALAEAVRDPAETRGLRQPDPEAPEVEDDALNPGADLEEEPLVLGADTSAATFVEDELPEVDQASEGVADTVGEEPSIEASDPVEVELEEEGPNSTEDEALGTPDDPQENLLALTPEQLRLLVSSMIHQELQGELGERITRNVRKMVRQEVHRALSVRDLE